MGREDGLGGGEEGVAESLIIGSVDGMLSKLFMSVDDTIVSWYDRAPRGAI